MLPEQKPLCVKMQGKRRMVSICCEGGTCLHFPRYSRPCEEACKQLAERPGASHCAQLLCAPWLPRLRVRSKSPDGTQNVFVTEEHGV